MFKKFDDLKQVKPCSTNYQTNCCLPDAFMENVKIEQSYRDTWPLFFPLHCSNRTALLAWTKLHHAVVFFMAIE